MDCRLGDVEANLGRARELVAEARLQRADLVVFPELALSGYSLGLVGGDVSLKPDDDRLVALVREADETSIVLGFLEADGTRAYNSAAYFEGGSLVHLHRKLYLQTFSPYEEHKHYEPGRSMRAFDTALGRMAMMVCNDAWRPALAFLAAQDGAHMILIPSNTAESHFPDEIDNQETWYDITRFYARMFQSYVVFVNRAGEEEEFKFWGGSHVVDSSGRIVAEAPRFKEDLIIVDLDLDAVRRRRRALPIFTEARLNLLSGELNRLTKEAKDPYR